MVAADYPSMQILEPLPDLFKLKPILAATCPLTSVIDEEIAKVSYYAPCAVL